RKPYLSLSALAEQLAKRSCDLRPGEWFWDQHDVLGVPGTETFVRLFRSVTNDDNGKLGVIRVVAHGVEERLAHVVHGTVEDQRIGALLHDQLVHGVGKARGEDFEAAVLQSDRQKL